MEDIVERLREKAARKSPNLYVEQQRIETEAADEIERLREALRPFAELGGKYVNDTDQQVIDNVDRWEFVVPFPDLRKAYEVLGEKK